MHPPQGMNSKQSKSSGALAVAGLFAGIGGIELGLARAGHHSKLLCEIDPGACRVLEMRFPDAPLTRDVREIEALPRVDLLAAGFPCQDLSQAGRTTGISGANSGLVGHVFRLLDAVKRRPPRWLLLENVPFMLQLQRGGAMRYLVDALEERGYTWAYRVVDARSFGLPQRRKRVILLASKAEDPRPVLFGDDAGERTTPFSSSLLCGFYWTEGLRGLGWAVDAVPTLKGGSTIGIPSPPAIWNPRDGTITTPAITDVERLQGFETDWTLPALSVTGVRPGHRWKLVGNAVSVPVAEWLGRRLVDARAFDADQRVLPRGVSWPTAAWGSKASVYSVAVSEWPVRPRQIHLHEFLQSPRTPLSRRAAAGFLSRAQVSGLRFEPGFLKDVERHIQRLDRISAA
jgi:DNA (cytosine-5)-methyltransferase 1